MLGEFWISQHLHMRHRMVGMLQPQSCIPAPFFPLYRCEGLKTRTCSFETGNSNLWWSPEYSLNLNLHFAGGIKRTTERTVKVSKTLMSLPPMKKKVQMFQGLFFLVEIRRQDGKIKLGSEKLSTLSHLLLCTEPKNRHKPKSQEKPTTEMFA